MVFNTATVSSAVTPVVIHTFISHYLNRRARAEKPTAHISYDEGLKLIREFLVYASHHTVEDIQRFTSQWVPNPRWVKVDGVNIAQEHISKSAEVLQMQLGHHGISRVGGKTWWQWRRPNSELKAEWIEMRADYHERKLSKEPGKRVMLYVHGGAYFFGSVDEHRYQMQRHARKLKARVFARDPSTIILAGDSAGGGMVLSMLVTLRDQGLPLPAGAVLISPWVDLTHSFPSVSGDNPMDYIPPWGFHHRPSSAWPPPNSDDMLAADEAIVRKQAHKYHQKHPEQSEEDAIRGFHIYHNVEAENRKNEATPETETDKTGKPQPNPVPRSGNLSIMINNNLVEVKDQIQMYATNQLITHPLISPVLQPSLGGLPPLLIMVGGGEMLRDEQLYLAHKAANPSKYPPSDTFLDEYPHDHARSQIDRWKPTHVQLQVWDDLCHVAPTLSFTRPAKYMYRSIAQFGAWALAKAQNAEIEIMDDDDVSVISRSDSDGEDEPEKEMDTIPAVPQRDCGQVGKAGDPLPRFKNYMIRQSVDRHGNTYDLAPESKLPGCNMPANEIGVIDEGLLKKWMARKEEWDTKFASTKRKVQKHRAKEIARGYQEFGDGEVPPPSALAGRRLKGEDLKERKNKRSMGMSLWALWGSKHDEKTIEAEHEADRASEPIPVSPTRGAVAGGLRAPQAEKDRDQRSRSRRRVVTDEHQTDDGVDENTSAADMLALREGKQNAENGTTPDFAPQPSILVRAPTNQDNGDDFDRKRPKAGGIAFPFSLAGHKASASMTTLTSSVGVRPSEVVEVAGAREDGLEGNLKSENGEAVGDGAAVGEGKGLERPQLETFVTASEGLPIVKGV